MNNVQKPMRKMLSLAVAGFMASNVSYAAGFSLYGESNGSAVGNFAAGVAAEAADASTGWYNPAGLALIREQEVVFGGIGIFPDVKLSGNTTFTTPPFPVYRQNFKDIDGTINAFVPSFHYAKPLGENATFGLSVVSPFGLSTDWSRLDPTRYAATFTELLTTTVSPEIGGRITDNLAFGIGLDLQWTRVKFNNVLGSPAVLQAIGANPIIFDSYSYNKGRSFGVGFHAGGMLMFNDNHTRIGLNYESEIKQNYHGYSRLTGNLATPFLNNHNAIYWSNDLASNTITFPQVITLSGYQDINDKLALLGSVVFTGWDTIKSISLFNVAAFIPAPVNNNGKANFTLPENWKNAWRASIGANYYWNDKLMLRFGTGYDQTPVTDTYRDIRLPDEDRWAIAVGAHYQWRPNLGFDLGYTYITTIETAKVNETIPLGTSSFNVNARGSTHANLVGAQVTWIIDQPQVQATK